MSANPYRNGINNLSRGIRINRGIAFGAIIITALMAFEVFNYSTTDYALSNLLGELEFAGLRWATILAIAFCGIDFAGIARLFSPEAGQDHNENWFLFGAWLLAATMNAMLTWWGVSLAILNHQAAGEAVIARENIIHIGPVFVAVLVWLIRVLIIGTFSVAGDRMFNQNPATQMKTSYPSKPPVRPQAAIAKEETVMQSALSRPRKTQTLTNSPTAVERPALPHRPSPRLEITPPEPEYENDENTSYLEPRYSRVPLAARSGNRSDLARSRSTEGDSYRIPVPPRRKS